MEWPLFTLAGWPLIQSLRENRRERYAFDAYAARSFETIETPGSNSSPFDLNTETPSTPETPKSVAQTPQESESSALKHDPENEAATAMNADYDAAIAAGIDAGMTPAEIVAQIDAGMTPAEIVAQIDAGTTPTEFVAHLEAARQAGREAAARTNERLRAARVAMSIAAVLKHVAVQEGVGSAGWESAKRILVVASDGVLSLESAHQYLSSANYIDLEPGCVPDELKWLLLRSTMEIAAADGVLTDDEEAAIVRVIRDLWGCSQEEALGRLAAVIEVLTSDHDPQKTAALEVLGLGDDHTTADIREAYLALVRQHHPDLVSTDRNEEATRHHRRGRVPPRPRLRRARHPRSQRRRGTRTRPLRALRRAHTIGHWTTTLAGAPTATNRTRRTRLVALAAVLVNRSGTPTLRYPARWPWQTQFHTTLKALRALPGPSG